MDNLIHIPTLEHCCLTEYPLKYFLLKYPLVDFQPQKEAHELFFTKVKWHVVDTEGID